MSQISNITCSIPKAMSTSFMRYLSKESCQAPCSGSASKADPSSRPHQADTVLSAR